MCSNRPIRQDVLHQLVWDHVAALLAAPQVVQQEWERRQSAAPSPSPLDAGRERDRLQQARRRVVDAYQERVVIIADFRERLQRLGWTNAFRY